MKIIDEKQKFDLQIVGYENPNSVEKDDGNWLIVQVFVFLLAQGSWSAKRSCLRTFELVELRNWFQMLMNGMTNDSSIGFTENELAFRYEKTGVLSIVLDFYFHPSGDKYDYEQDEEIVLNYRLEEINLNEIVDSLNNYISIYGEKKF